MWCLRGLQQQESVSPARFAMLQPARLGPTTAVHSSASRGNRSAACMAAPVYAAGSTLFRSGFDRKASGGTAIKTPHSCLDSGAAFNRRRTQHHL